MRKVIVFERKLIDGKWQIVEVGRGVFHAFGVNYEEFEQGPGNYSTAIVEFADGFVRDIPVGLIQFIQLIQE